MGDLSDLSIADLVEHLLNQEVSPKTKKNRYGTQCESTQTVPRNPIEIKRFISLCVMTVQKYVKC